MQRGTQPSHIGRYEVVRRIALGGMAEIFLARDRTVGDLSRLVAVKRIMPGVTEDPSFVAMFLDEMRVAARLSHQNIAHVYDFGEADGEYFIAMEFIDGVPLTRLLDALKPEPLPVEHAIRVGSFVAQGLFYAHRLRDEHDRWIGIVHRDVSPQNIMLSFDGQVKLLDFGIATARDQVHHTEHGVLKGKLAYMSPEQLLGRPVDHRADIFSLGVVVYEMVTGARLFARGGALAVMRAVCAEPIEPPSALRPELPRDLDPVLLKALARDPADRHQGADELCLELEQVLAQNGLMSNALLIGRFVDLVDPGRYEEATRRRKVEAETAQTSEWSITFRSSQVVSRSEIQRAQRDLAQVVVGKAAQGPTSEVEDLTDELEEVGQQAAPGPDDTVATPDRTDSAEPLDVDPDGAQDEESTVVMHGPSDAAEPLDDGEVSAGALLPDAEPAPARLDPGASDAEASERRLWLLLAGAIGVGGLLVLLAASIFLCAGGGP